MTRAPSVSNGTPPSALPGWSPTNDTREARGILPPARQGDAGSEERTRAHDALRAPRGRGPFGASHRQGRERGDAQALPGGEHAGEDRGPRRRRPRGIHQDDRPVSRQGEERGRAVEDPARETRRRGAPHARGPGSAARRGPQDRERGAERRLRRIDDGGRHARLPSGQSHGARARQESPRSGAQAPQGDSAQVPPERAPLPHPARALHLPREEAPLREMPGIRAVRVQGEEEIREGGRSAGEESEAAQGARCLARRGTNRESSSSTSGESTRRNSPSRRLNPWRSTSCSSIRNTTPSSTTPSAISTATGSPRAARPTRSSTSPCTLRL